ncbi:hypothetical protein VNO80_17911 [Phaseolus coccineus]|uniref:Uncharacterized protein n=1 Tax=Phaseolus coccineus TaxID=3886 RepID=A0AAN9QYY4_PHACN
MSTVHAKRYSSYTDPYEVKRLSSMLVQRFTHTIRGIQGALIVSACFHIVVRFLGIWRGAVRENAGLLALTPKGHPNISWLYDFLLYICYLTSAGLGFLQFFNLNSFRTKFVLGSSFFLGLSIPQYFIENFHVKHQHGWLNDMVSGIFMSHTTVAALIAFILDITLTCENDAARKDSGLQ